MFRCCSPACNLPQVPVGAKGEANLPGWRSARALLSTLAAAQPGPSCLPLFFWNKAKGSLSTYTRSAPTWRPPSRTNRRGATPVTAAPIFEPGLIKIRSPCTGPRGSEGITLHIQSIFIQRRSFTSRCKSHLQSWSNDKLSNCSCESDPLSSIFCRPQLLSVFLVIGRRCPLARL